MSGPIDPEKRFLRQVLGGLLISHQMHKNMHQAVLVVDDQFLKGCRVTFLSAQHQPHIRVTKTQLRVGFSCRRVGHCGNDMCVPRIPAYRTPLPGKSFVPAACRHSDCTPNRAVSGMLERPNLGFYMNADQADESRSLSHRKSNRHRQPIAAEIPLDCRALKKVRNREPLPLRREGCPGLTQM